MNNKMPGKKKPDAATITIYAVIVIFAFYVIAGLGAAIDQTADKNGKPQMKLVGEMFSGTLSRPATVFSAIGGGGYAAKFLLMAVFALGIYALYKWSEKKRLHRKGVEHGSAVWGDEKEMESLQDKMVREPKFQRLRSADGQYVFDEDGDFCGVMVDNDIILTKEVHMSLNSRQHLMNLNVLIVGGSGSGKTRFYAKPNIMQLNTSYVITDPKGEILQATGKMLFEAGYDLKVFNLVEMMHSNNYNPFHYVYDYDGNLSEDKIIKMVNVFMTNTKGDGEKEDFWSISASKIIQAVVFLLFEESEYDAKRGSDGQIIPETRDFSSLNWFSVAQKLQGFQYPSANQKDGFFIEDEAARTEAFLSPLDRDFWKLKKRGAEKGLTAEPLAFRLYKEVRAAPADTGNSIVATASSRTQMFNLKMVANLTCTDEIRLETLGDKKSALFIIISATDSTYNFLASMMYTQMFDVLADRANFKFGGMLPVPVRCIMDEFANIGQIPDFDKVIAFVRSMGMSLNVIIQNIAQLKARYEKTWEIITGNCDSFLFLGGKEESTLKYVSEALGKETIDVEAKNRTKGRQSSTSESNSILGRELMTPDEIAKMPIDKCVLMVRSHNPFYCSKFPIEQHVNFKWLEDFDKKNAFDKASIHAKTVEDIRPRTEAPDSVEAEIKEAEKRTRVIFLAENDISADVSSLTVKSPEAEDSIEDLLGDTAEDFAAAYVRIYGEVSDAEFLDTGEPKTNQKEADRYEMKTNENGLPMPDDEDTGEGGGETCYIEGNYEEPELFETLPESEEVYAAVSPSDAANARIASLEHSNYNPEQSSGFTSPEAVSMGSF